ncbi:MAG: hypothetical protein ACN6N5_10370, partial [Diaphorobacter nitroreducens]
MSASTLSPPPHQPRRRRMLVAGTLAFAAAAGGLWGVPGLRSALRPQPAPALEPDVCIVAPPT